MPHDIYLKFIDRYPAHNMLITDEELNSLGIEVPSQKNIVFNTTTIIDKLNVQAQETKHATSLSSTNNEKVLSDESFNKKM